MMKDNAESGDGGEGGGEEMGNIYISSEQIIKEVQKYRCLYDPAVPEHKDRDVVRDAWLSVSQAVVGEPWESMNSAEKDEAAREVVRRWRNIRDCMRRSLRSRNGNRTKAYAFHNELAFLLETEPFKKRLEGREDNVKVETKTRARPFRLRPQRNTGDVNYSDDASATREGDELSETSDSLPASGSPRSKRKKNKPQQFLQATQKESLVETGQSTLFVGYNNNMPDANSLPTPNYPCYQAPEPENPDRMFLLSLLPKFSALSSRNKLDFQIKTMQTLQEYEKDEESKS